MDYSVLVEKAKEAAKNAYMPYSQFPVGACVMGESGNLFTGCNFENASYGLTVCAERNAVGSAITGGEKKITACAIYSPKMNNCTPCGACRQVLYEFKSDKGMQVITCNDDGCTTYTIEQLLPEGFNL